MSQNTFHKNKELIDDLGFQVQLPLTQGNVHYHMKLQTKEDLTVTQTELTNTPPKRFKKKLLERLEAYEELFLDYMRDVREKLQ